MASIRRQGRITRYALAPPDGPRLFPSIISPCFSPFRASMEYFFNRRPPLFMSAQEIDFTKDMGGGNTSCNIRVLSRSKKMLDECFALAL